MTNQSRPALVLGALIALGLVLASWLLAAGALRYKEYERVVSVKGLAEREVPADVAVWPIRFVAASNDMAALYQTMEQNAAGIQFFLQEAGFSADEITTSAPLVTDKYAERYGDQNANLRYTAQQTITIYSGQVDRVRQSQSQLVELGKQGIAFGGDEYSQRINYLFTQLNDLKPAMIEEATRNARVAAQQFADDSASKLGKLRTARQGQFTIEDRDDNTPYLKRVRVVSTVEYYLVD